MAVMLALMLKKKRLFEFLSQLQRYYELIAPVKDGLVRFEKINDVNDIFLEKSPYFPLKEYFFKKEETLFSFDGKKIIAPKISVPERIFFGIRRCDLNAIMHQDKAFIEDANDPYYKSAREKSFLIGYHCKNACSPYCFCGSMGLVDFYDLMLYDKGKNILVDIGTEKGNFLVKKFSRFFSKTGIKIGDKEKIIAGADRL